MRSGLRFIRSILEEVGKISSEWPAALIAFGAVLTLVCGGPAGPGLLLRLLHVV